MDIEKLLKNKAIVALVDLHFDLPAPVAGSEIEHQEALQDALDTALLGVGVKMEELETVANTLMAKRADKLIPRYSDHQLSRAESGFPDA